MQPKAIFVPMCAQALLTMAVWAWMYVKRLGAIFRLGVAPQELADEARAAAVFKDAVNPSDNLENLFELPVLFFAALLAIHAAGLADPLYLGAAWVFVSLRAVHSLVHCTSNRISLRFFSYVAGSVVLWAMWIRFAAQLC